MRHSKRHLPYAVSTVLGLAAPALAAVLLTSSTPGLAAVPLPQQVASERVEHVDRPLSVVEPRAAARPVVHRVMTVRRTVQPKAVTRHVTVHRFAAKPVVRRVHRTVSSQTAQPWGTDDYPYRSQSAFYATDRWGFTERQCVSFAAWRLAQHGHAIDNAKDSWGSAYNWDDTARRLGFSVTHTARVGEIAQWNAHESGAYYSKGASKPDGSFVAGGYGHVGWVKQVYSDGSALVEQYNMGSSRSYSVMRVKAPRYLSIR